MSYLRDLIATSNLVLYLKYRIYKKILYFIQSSDIILKNISKEYLDEFFISTCSFDTLTMVSWPAITVSGPLVFFGTILGVLVSLAKRSGIKPLIG